MIKSTHFFFSKILYKHIYNIDNSIIGNLHDLVVDFSLPLPVVRAIVVKNGKREFFIMMQSLEVTHDDKERYTIKLNSQNLSFVPIPETDVFLARDFLDKQIIDIEGKKVERVNDVRIAWVDNNWVLIAVDIGFRGLMRRLGIEYLGIYFSTKLNKTFRNTLVAWEDVQALTHGTDNLQLNSSVHKLNTLHVADLADILEDLDKKAQVTLFQSLDTELAADVLEEIESETQVSLIENLSIEQATDVLELMPIDEVADILEEMEVEQVNRLLNDMDEDNSQEIRELLKYKDKTVGSLMMIDFLAFSEEMKVKDILGLLKDTEYKEETSHYIYIVNQYYQLTGVVSLMELIRSDSDSCIKNVIDENQQLVYLNDDDSVEKAMEWLLKYNLMILPVLDHNHVLIGITSTNDLVNEFGKEWDLL